MLCSTLVEDESCSQLPACFINTAILLCLRRRLCQLLPTIAYVVLNCADNGVTVYTINAVTVAALLIVHTVLC
jgi:hypothetical protein